MKQETYKKATELVNDIASITKQLNEVIDKYCWIAISTPLHKEKIYSVRFQKELTEWMKMKKEEYQKEFEELV